MTSVPKYVGIIVILPLSLTLLALGMALTKFAKVDRAAILTVIALQLMGQTPNIQ